MSLRDFISKQFIDVIQWTETDQDTLAWRFPMQDQEIQTGGKLTVRESQAAAFVNEGRIADIFGPGLFTLNTQTLPFLTNLMNWDKAFQNPFKSDVYFFSTRLKTDQRWGTATPITIRDKEFGAIRIRGYGIYSWHIDNPRQFHTKVSGTREMYKVLDLEGQLRNTIVSRMTGAFAESGVPFLDMAANQTELAAHIAEGLKPMFADLGLALDSFVVENLSLPEELQKMLDTRVGMNMLGDMNRYTQFQVANSMPIAAANQGGGVAGIGVGLGAGMVMGNQMMNAMNPGMQPGMQQPPQAPPPMAPPSAAPPAPAPAGAPAGAAPGSTPAAGGGPAAPGAETKFCVECGKSIARKAKFCPECGGSQQ
ncbi:MAG TPA: SPFH domain-containing protein [Bryobacteraceae bacterium]|jgi:membrane protease subunit (stomatin/prohibitin family)